jgi:hypothetical protein
MWLRTEVWRPVTSVPAREIGRPCQLHLLRWLLVGLAVILGVALTVDTVRRLVWLRVVVELAIR